MTDVAATGWVGNRLPRQEDQRLIRGRGRYTDDIAGSHAYCARFVRSSAAFGRIVGIDTSRARELPGVRAVLTAEDLGVPSLTAVLERDEFVPTAMPLLAHDVVRYAGDPVAIVVATDRYVAEDGADLVDVDIDPLPPVMSVTAALGRTGTDPAVHDEAPDGVLVDLQMFSDARLPDIFASAALVLDEHFTSGRVHASPMENRACLAEWVDRDDQLVLTLSTQVPHLVRTGLARALGIAERQVRVIAPDVGGGFGLKCVVGREELVVAAAARHLHHAVRWTEDRQEDLVAAFHGREQEYHIRAGFDTDGRLLGLDADIKCDIGSYSVFPFSCAVEPLMAASELPGVYKIPHYAARGRGVSTNKTPTAPYRGVSRPQIVMVMETLMDRAGAELGIDRFEMRRRNTIGPDDFPYQGANGITYEPGSYVEALEVCLAEIDRAGWWTLRDTDDPDVVRGVGVANFNERTAYGTETMGLRKMQVTPGFDVSHVTMDGSGNVVVTTGTQSTGQGHETAFAQIVADRLGIRPDQVKLRQGDTEIASFGWGTWGSRSLVIGGGAAAVAARHLADQLRDVAGALLEASPDDIELVDGEARVRGATGTKISIPELAHTVHYRSHLLPDRGDHLLEARGVVDPPGMFSNACHAALVEVDRATGAVTVLDYLVVEDCGVVVNPTIVEGQVRGGVAQGIASALFEQCTYSDDGQPLAGTFMDYLVPTASEIPQIAIHHLETPCDQTEIGAKGMGEGGTIGSPATIVSAVNDALRGSGSWIQDVPIRPDKLVTIIAGSAAGQEKP